MSKKSDSEKIILNVLKAASVTVVAFGLIIFLSVVIGGDKWDVNAACKLPLSVPNIVLFLIALAVMSVTVVSNFLVLKKSSGHNNSGNKKDETKEINSGKADLFSAHNNKNEIVSEIKNHEKKIDKKIFIITTISLVLIYAVWYVINIKISKKIAFSTGWDPSCVQGTAYNLFKGGAIGNDGYYSTYPNNIPMVWILYRSFDFIKRFQSYPYYAEFFWIQILCVLESVTGIVLGITSYVSTKKIFPVAVSTILYLALIGISPWSIIPYTDTFSILFPILGLCFYFLYLEMKKNVKYALLFAACLFITLGSLIKITVVIVLISIVISEILRIVFLKKENVKRIAIVAAVVLSVIPFYFGLKTVTYKDTGAELLDNLSVSWQHYFYMGLIEETTGAYNSDAFSLIGQYQFRPKSERSQKELELAKEIIDERGPVRSVLFYLKKLVMTYNDGTFTWRGEGGVKYGDYPDISSESFREALRSFFWNGGSRELVFNAYSQCVWILILLGFLIGSVTFSIKLFKDKKVDFMSFTSLLSIVGITLFIMLFEARARYLYNFVPIFILLCSTGMYRLSEAFAQTDKGK